MSRYGINACSPLQDAARKRLTSAATRKAIVRTLPHACLVRACTARNPSTVNQAVSRPSPGLVARALRALVLCSVVLLVMACAIGCSTATTIEPRAPTPGAPRVTVMTYNVHQDRWNDASTVAAVGAADADIVCLQEVSKAWRRVLEERYASQYPFMRFATREDYGGLAILSKYPVEDGGVLTFGTDFHPAWYGIADTPSGRVQIMHVHLRAMFDGDSNAIANLFGKSRDHLAELVAFMSKTAPGISTLVIGDFNESPKGKAVRWLESRGFRNALPIYQPGQVTWKGKAFAAMFNETVDHVMFDGSFKALWSWVDRSGGSDHLPVLASLELSRGVGHAQKRPPTAPAWSAD
jgi:endonuclease/exonuclease/phosphatase family metal-dependent hydrolase